IALYKKQGFAIEGIRRHSLLINGQFVDEFSMAKLLDQPALST
ncbi:MAG: GNAT family N-acetyltransferase, partial [Ktedonobacteraceae bacterium]